MNQPLFRAEVLQARRAGWLGGISLAQPLRSWVLGAAAVFVAVSAMTFLCIGTYAHRSIVTGQLVPTRGLATVMAPATGVVTRLDVSEGQRVKVGQLLAVVTVPRATLGSGDTEQALQHQLRQRGEGLKSSEQAQLQQLDAQEQGLRAQLVNVRQELVQVNSEISTRRSQVLLANEVLQRWRQLQDDRYVSALQIKQQESSALEYTGQMQALQRQATEMRRNAAQIEQQLQVLPGQRDGVRADYRRDAATVEQEQVQTQVNGALVVTTPVAGVVATQMAKPGQAIQLGQPLMSVVPGDGRMEAELLVPSRAIGFIAPGDTVLLRYQAFPYEKFGLQQGQLSRISRSALSPSELGALIGNAQQGEPYYRVTVALKRQSVMAYGKPEMLKPGMLLQADIIGERRSLIEWVFEPLYALQSKLLGT
ncbi:HlyD family efflux transporter periplasmic adaptor subunit [Xanthomonas prunicola]|uniref:HlyD family efflux transporter periplasmic adaptor subunit n=1 Tax=Xanthomonas prunicola TaxID=2053930 RepID=A0A9Q9IX59_9XANT|nr:HlyD family efflux transporter periplasmic adaptor subunit [Xanthomonas prunicola]USI99298.1 HlyD family efflux transporter periplasmic adaptor subunit [Xanthomonas prunicola]UXA47720.1 HlyD family efflux transporter periplasmic adaptor subunit [Xanthomonas prunicola]UXA56182.1 HlyD family efflux transporter periplasmic adaptor subunit [Xanthomonas prunicola]UXA62156.1 HlyD family efflux transporter periplasmic adaptor subunit [Xanthomonas prunicola]UXA64354.1 HlyD family efflux transporter